MCNNVSNSEQIRKAYEEGKTDKTDVWYREWYALRLKEFDMVESARMCFKAIIEDIDDIWKNQEEYDIDDIQDFKQELRNRIVEYIEMRIYFDPNKQEVKKIPEVRSLDSSHGRAIGRREVESS